MAMTAKEDAGPPPSSEKLFAAELDFPRATPPSVPYLLLATARSGSTMLCSSLTGTRQAGVPLEYLSHHNLGLYTKAYGPPELNAYLSGIVSRRTSPNGRFGLKLMVEQFTGIFGKRPEQGDRFLRSYSRFIRVSRRDKVEQAISIMLALERQVWHAEHVSEKPPERGFMPSDVPKISSCLAVLVAKEQFWKDVVAKLNLRPIIEIVYEDLVADTPAEVARTLRHLGIEVAPGDIPSPKTIKLAGEGSRDIKREYLRAIGLTGLHTAE